jgi:peptidoglycan/LPS O-acetylase OafA/YrhL
MTGEIIHSPSRSLWTVLRERLGAIYEIAEGTNKTRLQSMEGLRGLAILLVFLSHYQNIILGHLGIGGTLNRLGLGMMEAGGTGVDLFFVLSGMLIYRAVLKPNLKVTKFLKRRAQRIYPTFLAVFAIYVAMNILLMMGPPRPPPYNARIPMSVVPAIGYLLANLAFLPGLFPIQPLLNVAWSLSYEWFFYLSLPFIVIAAGLTARKPASRARIFLSAAVLFWAASCLFPDVFFMRSNPIRASHIGVIMFFCGMILSDLMDAGFKHVSRLADGIALVLLVVALAAPFYYGYEGFRLLPPSPETVRTEALIAGALFVGFGIAVFCTLNGNHLLNRIFRWTPLRWLGNMSYSFYLIHGLPMHAIALLMARAAVPSMGTAMLITVIVAMLPVTFLITSAVSTVLFWYVEKPFSLVVKRPASNLEAALQQTAP